jgi:SAM-dependent methyltransferase
MKSEYNDAYYEQIHKSSQDSANEIAPIIYDMFHPTSVLDVGCGLGEWLAAFKHLGVQNILGIDFGEVSSNQRYISPCEFKKNNLETPFLLSDKYDITLCLEVAEHLSKDFSTQLVENLTKSSNIIVFSAAVPFQGGVGHLNERPASYWMNIFNAFHFAVLDIIRPQIWDNPNIAFWYKQNILVFTHQDILSSMMDEFSHIKTNPIYDIIHLDMVKNLDFQRKVELENIKKQYQNQIKKIIEEQSGLKKSFFNFCKALKRKIMG